MYDVIGDIHGQHAKLTAILAKLGYRNTGGALRHDDGRKAVFVGDLIDRGPHHEAVIETVRAMIDAGTGHAVMGNHEWNAIGYATRSDCGKTHLRRRSVNETKQHAAFLAQIGLDSPRHAEIVNWLKTLPVL